MKPVVVGGGVQVSSKIKQVPAGILLTTFLDYSIICISKKPYKQTNLGCHVRTGFFAGAK